MVKSWDGAATNLIKGVKTGRDVAKIVENNGETRSMGPLTFREKVEEQSSRRSCENIGVGGKSERRVLTDRTGAVRRDPTGFEDNQRQCGGGG